MADGGSFEIFLACPPGLEGALADEAREAGFRDPRPDRGGVVIEGGWPEVWRANLTLRGAVRVLTRIGAFRAFHLAQLDKRARKFPWLTVLRADVPVRVDVTTNRKSKIYHAGAAQQRIETALAESAGVAVSAKAEVTIKARIDDNLVILSVDTSGESLHKRGHKPAIGKAPIRETMAAMFLRQCGFSGDEPVFDPMCGSGTFVLEAAEMAAELLPGRGRTFAFEQLASFDAAQWTEMRQPVDRTRTTQRFRGSDRNAGAFTAARANAERAGVADLVTFQKASVSEIAPPEGPPGLVIANPPYGTRIGERAKLFPLYSALGTSLRERFGGWRVGIVTTEASLIGAMNLPLGPPGPVVPHGGLKVRLWQTGPLP
ncbi:class I SAM-dependent RNA methyltransferase [Jannaschia sp. S6380]|uniref:THUMP domain-containing class I SAM-dependent RNA methyltransferase n=1 Tax=Jannaschia sp. S6380 TaxID=2926408 RepID=UPI001FF19C6D|nr:class I SAM-dependent RNA methyltransferase [Jannaschia sp. S6380]MCK0169360.1 class I SAM-dependent RNA methyltransferase [Jannaschia sp. S6380]